MFQRRSGVDVGIHVRCRLECGIRQAACNPHHLHHVLDPLFAQRIGVHHLVGQRQLVINHVQMADRGVDIHRLHRIAARKVDAVEILRQLEQIGAHLPVARHLGPDLHVPIVGGRGHIAKVDVPPADGDLAVRITGGQRELGRGLAHHLHHECTVHADNVAVDGTARLTQDFQSLLIQELHADLFEDAHGPVVNGRDTFGAQRLDRGIHHHRRVPGHLFDHCRPAPRRGPCPSAAT
mmetsp:Transcript_7554/g.12952  ORF Transcript_7554/g.12952 Transcript_7554/m.12952 type:complete len:236 (-) Transcript_7554:1212-1919(-)